MLESIVYVNAGKHLVKRLHLVYSKSLDFLQFYFIYFRLSFNFPHHQPPCIQKSTIKFYLPLDYSVSMTFG